MRPLLALYRYRDHEWEAKIANGEPLGLADRQVGGAFVVPSDTDPGTVLRIIASSGMGWDHVSISTTTRCPTWAEMEQIKHLFFRPAETAMQLHVPQIEHINCHPYCLHLWRPHFEEIPRPPSIMVGLSA